MKTPIEYTHNLEHGIVTLDMLAQCIYSCNKRAKNYRDMEKHYREKRQNNYYWYDKYHHEAQNRKKKEEFYAQKEFFLSYLEPDCIHKVNEIYKYVHVYESESDCFGKIYMEKISYYLYYRVNDKYSFHTPIDNPEKEEYQKYKIKEIEDFETYGLDINELLSCQFVNKVQAALEYGNAKLIS